LTSIVLENVRPGPMKVLIIEAPEPGRQRGLHLFITDHLVSEQRIASGYTPTFNPKRRRSAPELVSRHEPLDTTLNSPSIKISLNGVLGRLATFRTDVAPGPPLCTSKVKDTLVPAPRPVMLAVPVKVALSPLTTASATCPVTY